MFKYLTALIITAFVITACGTAPEEESVVQVIESVAQAVTEIPATEVSVIEPTIAPTEETIVEPTIEPTIEPTVEVIIEPSPLPVENTYNAPEWTAIPLVNAATGESFTLADFAGQTVFVEPMATWCSNCRAQQGNVARAMESLDPDQFVFISLSVGENVSNESLAMYAQRNGFPQLFAVAPDDLARTLVDTFGFTVASPPATPHFTISPTGVVSTLYTGYHNPDELVQQALSVQNS